MNATAIEVKERGILFSTEMVRALLAGKTQTRRAIKPQPCMVHVERVGIPPNVETLFAAWASVRGQKSYLNCPYGVVGDRLWVRESFAEFGRRHRSDGSNNRRLQTFYKATHIGEITKQWTKARLMPRWASRITLEITDVRVQRVQSISEEDAIAEGVLAQNGDGAGNGAGFKWSGMGYHGAGFTDRGERTFHTPNKVGCCSCHVAGDTPAQCAYRELWDSINGAGSWKLNPWTWAITFKRIGG